jgi:ABC-type multidrug transport system fused ATPase/permease subunit
MKIPGRRRRRTRLRDTIVHELVRARRGLLLAAAATVSYTAMQLLIPWPLKLVFDQVLLDKPLPGSLSFLHVVLDRGEVFALVVIAVSMVVLALVRGMCSYAQLYITSRIGYEVMRAVQRALFGHLQRLSLAFHNRARGGELLTRITSDTTNLRDTVASYAVPSVGDSLTLVGMFVVMALMDPALALIPLASFPVLYLVLRGLYRRTRTSARRQRKGEGNVAARINEVLTAVSLVQAYGRERYEEERLADQTAQTMRDSIRTGRLEAANSRSVEAISAVATAAVVLLGALRVRSGALTPGELLVFTGYLSAMYRPVRNLSKAATKLSRAAVSAERIGSLLELEPDIRDTPDAIPAHPLRGEVVFEGVRFSYGADDVLAGVGFRIAPGQRVALVGPSGAGKSTIASLLLRFYDPAEGCVRIDGIDVRRYQLESLRRQIAIVPQDSVLFGASVYENIAYGAPDATREEILAAARAANAHDFIMALDDGYDTVIAERGASLSGGQRRRIAIARALVRNAPILILDEPMTGLDVASEAAVREALDRLMAGRTCLTITHDLQSVTDADQVLLLDGGRVEDGRHAELVASSLTYRRLVQQAGGAARTAADGDDMRRGAPWPLRASETGSGAR